MMLFLIEFIILFVITLKYILYKVEKNFTIISNIVVSMEFEGWLILELLVLESCRIRGRLWFYVKRLQTVNITL